MAVPRSLRLGFIAALVLFLLSAVYLSYTYTNNLPASTGFIEHAHNHELSGEDDIVLAFPNDPIPRFNFATLSDYPPNNIGEPSRFAFATLYCTRDADTRDPYFEATQSIIWRLLWSEYRSKYPIVVFVCPFIPEQSRRILRGQGAMVKEIELLDDIIPDEEIRSKRWIDVLSKLNLWKEIEWKRIVFLDSDAFPIMNIDDIFDIVPVQECTKELLGQEDKAVVENGGNDICHYVYAGVSRFSEDNINAGMLVLMPNLDMHAKLIRAAKKTNEYNVKHMEQGVLKSKNAFAADGPFPVQRLPTIWNADPDYYAKYLEGGSADGPLRILHAKLWTRFWGASENLIHLSDMWDLDWMKMCRYYDSDEGYVEARMTGIYKTPWERYLENQENS